VEDLGTVFAFADITMTLLAFVNLIALAMLFKIGLRILNDYDAQRKAGIKTPVFDSSQFPDLDLDLKAWPKPVDGQPAAKPATATGKPAIDTP
jgi:AGCS family alanine or glycine:cation symporter